MTTRRNAAALRPQDVVGQASANPVNAALLRRLKPLGLGQCHLAAGCVFQAVWNQAAGQPPGWGVRDYDVFYFDDRDLSWEAEDAVIRRVDALTQDLGVTVETRNQARVHLWFPQRFGAACPALVSACDGIDRYLIACTCVGIEVATGALYAPDGLLDLQAGVLRPNPRTPNPALFRPKAEDYRRRWPWLRIVE